MRNQSKYSQNSLQANDKIDMGNLIAIINYEDICNNAITYDNGEGQEDLLVDDADSVQSFRGFCSFHSEKNFPVAAAGRS